MNIRLVQQVYDDDVLSQFVANVQLIMLATTLVLQECHQSYCALSPDGIDLMHVQCINGKCPNMMNWCTYIRLPTTGTTGMRLDTWNHMTMEGYFCVICCMTYNSGGSVVGGAVDARLPSKLLAQGLRNRKWWKFFF